MRASAGSMRVIHGLPDPCSYDAVDCFGCAELHQCAAIRSTGETSMASPTSFTPSLSPLRRWRYDSIYGLVGERDLCVIIGLAIL